MPFKINEGAGPSGMAKSKKYRKKVSRIEGKLKLVTLNGNSKNSSNNMNGQLDNAPDIEDDIPTHFLTKIERPKNGMTNGKEKETANGKDLNGTDTDNSELPLKRKRRKRKAKVTKRKKKDAYVSFSFTDYVTDSQNKCLNSVMFSMFIKNRDIFATAGGNRVTIYEALPEKKVLSKRKKKKLDSWIKPIRCYQDLDEEEVYNTVAWSISSPPERDHLLLFAGKNGIIRIVNCQNTNKETANLISHGGEINEIKVAPRSTSLLFSASNDGSIRMWNIAFKNLICIFGGVDGHRDSVISLDTYIQGGYIASGSLDHSINIWKYDTAEIKLATAKSCSENFMYTDRSVPRVHYPHFHTREIHRNYVDGLRWFGDMIISKSTDDPIIVWQAGNLDSDLVDLKENEKEFHIVHEFPLNESDIFSIRLEYGYSRDYLAVGDQEGRVFIWRLNVPDPLISKYTILSCSECTQPIRQVAFSSDNKILIAISDDSKVWRWDFQSENLIT